MTVEQIDGQTRRQSRQVSGVTATNLKMAVDMATASLILGIQEHIGYENPVSVEVVGKQPIRYGLRYTIEVKVDDGVTLV